MPLNSWNRIVSRGKHLATPDGAASRVQLIPLDE